MRIGERENERSRRLGSLIGDREKLRRLFGLLDRVLERESRNLPLEASSVIGFSAGALTISGSFWVSESMAFTSVIFSATSAIVSVISPFLLC